MEAPTVPPNDFMLTRTLNPFVEPVELDPRLRRRPLTELDFNAVIWGMKTHKVC